MANVLAVLEQRGGALKQVSHEVLTAARTLADAAGGTVDAIVLGPGGVDVSGAGGYGADRVIVVESDDLSLYQPEPYAAAIVAQTQSGDYAAVVLAATAMGKDLAPRVAGRLDCPLAADVTALEWNDGPVASRPLYSGKAIAKLQLTASPCVISVRPNVFNPVENAREGTEQKAAPSETELRARTVEIKEPEKARLDVAEAPIVVSGGRGLKEAENFKLVEELADALGNAAVGASRAVVDAGWRSHAEQVGQTGKTVSPQLYVAVGISGAIQHLAGMRTSKVIVAINKDSDAPIFKVADYGIVGDLFEVVPRLTQEIKNLRGG
jgi:electron transfer flavoprotein alpha subunit